jgi:hypothetical protein
VRYPVLIFDLDDALIERFGEDVRLHLRCWQRRWLEGG